MTIGMSQMQKPRQIAGLMVDSLKDIATNKLFATVERNEPKDLVDQKMIHPRRSWVVLDSLSNLAIDRQRSHLLNGWCGFDLKYCHFSIGYLPKMITNHFSRSVTDVSHQRH